ncbi:sialidase family protein [Micromonospora chersina]|uniref:WD40/YVTN/BNR-like repeat-containing protein n=1 Tax=Micromonospora chersina TaxID=47854 RepID=UPI0033C0AD92
MPELDFTGLKDAAYRGFKPQFENVVAVARRRRRRRRVLTVATAAMVLAGSGVAVAARPDAPAPPSVGVGGVRTPDFIPVPGGTPSPGTDQGVATGRPVAGDLDHIYLRWSECSGCRIRWAGTEDRGRHWRTGDLPASVNGTLDLRAVGPRTVVARSVPRSAPDNRYAEWVASTDGGSNWRRVQPRTVEALPAGWPVLSLRTGPTDEPLVAVDPATGDVAQLNRRSTLHNAMLVESVPAEAGLWVSGFTGERIAADDRIIGTGGAVEVSRDGGSTWSRHAFPDDLAASDDVGGPAVATRDGRTVYAIGRVRGSLVVWRSADGGATWTRAAGTAAVGDRTIRAALRPDGVLVVQAGISAREDPLMLASSDGGATWDRTALGPGADPRPVPGGFVQTGWPDSKGVWLSTDGATWSWLDPPELP